MNNLIGQQIDHYRIDALIGEGGMGAVYRAYDLNLALPVALKVMHQHLANQTEFQQRFMQEAQAAARLRHPSVVNIKYFDAKQGFLFMVMDLVTGPGLGNYLRRQAPVGQTIHLSETLYLLAQVAGALDYAHKQGIVHRDVKPDNVLIQPLEQPDRDGEPSLRAVVTDFGLAKLYEGGIQTSTGTFMGTLPYMSPEQCLGTQLDGRSDIYSLGIMLYQLATGRLPFDVKTPVEAAEKHIRAAPPDPCKIQPGLPDSVEKIIQRTIAKDPADRYQQASQLAADLRQAASNLTESEITQYAAYSTVVSLMTHLQQNSQEFLEPSRMGLNLTSSGSDDQLLVALKDHTPLTYNLDKPHLTIGRAAENDIVLVEDGVSRRHARLERSAAGWRVVDLASTNGTFLDRQKLLPDVPEEWNPGQTLRLGPYFLHWKQSSRQTAYTGATALLSVVPGSTQVQSSSGQLGLVINPAEIKVEPGQQSKVQVELIHLGSTVEHFALRVDELPADWVTLPAGSLPLMPNEHTTQEIRLHPPRHSSAPAGTHTFKVTVQSITNPNEAASVPAQLDLAPYEDFSVDLHPSRLSSGASSQITITNQGNTDSVFSINGRDPADAVHFTGLRGRLKVPPGGSQTSHISVKARQRPLMGTQKTLPFEVQINAQNDVSRSLAGEVNVRPIFPWWAILLFGTMLAFLCVGAAVVFGRPFFDNDPPGIGGGIVPTTAELGQLPVASTAAPTQGDDGAVGGVQPQPDQPQESTITATTVLTDTPTFTPSATATAIPTSTGTQAAPAAADDSFQAMEDNPLTINVVENDSDSDGSLNPDSLSVTSAPSHGSANPAGSGMFEYVPDPNYYGPDSFDYRICDEDGLCDTASVNLEIQPVNDAPLAGPDSSYSVNEDQTLTVNSPGVLGNDKDDDNDKLTANLENQAKNGSANLQSNGSFSYAPKANFCGEDTFTYTASDGQGGTGTATVKVEIKCINDKPDAGKDVYQDALEDVTYKVPAPGVLKNDTDVDKNDSLTVTLVTDRQELANSQTESETIYGKISLNKNGSFTYQPGQDFCSSSGRIFVFTYQVSDGKKTDQADASIVVKCISEKPTYRITVKTGDREDAGTDAAVFIRLFGWQEATSQSGYKLASDGVDDHERGKQYAYDMVANDGLGKFKYAEIWLANGSKSNKDGWFMESVRITRSDTGESYTFTCNKWFDADSNGNIIKRRLEAGVCK